MIYGTRVLCMPKGMMLSPVDFLFEKISLEELKDFKRVVINEKAYNCIKKSQLFTEKDGAFSRPAMIYSGKSLPELSFTLAKKSPFATEWYILSLDYGKENHFRFSNSSIARGISISVA